MAAILAKKLGMTQRFLDDGRVERVTVLEAGPCHVTGIRTEERDGYDAVQLAFGAVKEKRLTKARARPPQEGRRARRCATCVEFRDEAGELQVGDEVTRRGLRAGPDGEDLRRLEGQGLPGHDQAPQLQPRARRPTARTTSAPRARSAPPPRPRACSRASGPRPHGRQARHPAGPRGRRGRSPTATCCCVRGAVPGPEGRHRGGADRWLAARPRGCDKQGGVDARRRGVRREVERARSCTSACAPSSRRAGRARRPPRRAARSAAAAPSRGARRAPAAPARARSARPSGPAAASPSAPRRATTPSRSTARPAAPRCAARSRCTPSRGSLAVVDAGALRRAVDQAGRRSALAEWRRRARPCSWCSTRRGDRGAKSFRNIDARRRARRRRRGHRRHRRRASLVVSRRLEADRRATARRRRTDARRC